MAVTLRVGMPTQALPRRATRRQGGYARGFPRRSVGTIKTFRCWKCLPFFDQGFCARIYEFYGKSHSINVMSFDA